MKKLSIFHTGMTSLAVASVISKILGAFYRIPLTNVLGADGMGLYQLVFPIYAFAIALTSGGISLATSKCVAFAGEENEGEQRGFLNGALLTVGVSGLVFGALIFFFSNSLAALQGANVGLCYKIVAPSVAFSGLIAALRGYYLGKSKAKVTAFSQVAEQLARLCFGLLFANALKDRGTFAATCGAIAGVSVSELTTFLLLFFYHLATKGKPAAYNGNYCFCTVFRSALPVTLGSAISPTSQFFDSFITVNLLSRTLGTVQATAHYGILSGVVSSLVNLPVSLAIALASAVVPKISKAKSSSALSETSGFSLKIAFCVGVLSASVFAVFAREITAFLYPSFDDAQISLAALLLVISSINVVSLTANQIYAALLQGVGLQRIPTVNLFVCALVKIPLSVFLTLRLGIVGTAISGVICYGLCLVLNLAKWRKISKCEKLPENVSKICLAGVIIIAVSYALKSVIKDFALAILPVCAVLFLGLITAFKVFHDEVTAKTER